MRFLLTSILFLFGFSCIFPQSVHDIQTVISSYIANYRLSGYCPSNSMRADSVRIKDDVRRIDVYTNDAFSSQPFTAERIARIRYDIRHLLPSPYNVYELNIYGNKKLRVEDLIPNYLRKTDSREDRIWKDTRNDVSQWVRNISLPYRITKGLQGRHLFIWPSHGRYFNGREWRWQRPYLYATTEDLFTQSIVLPYLFPMLEKAGAIVYSPRERDPQVLEAVVDNDVKSSQGIYQECNGKNRLKWKSGDGHSGFAPVPSGLNDSILPFRCGTYRWIESSSERNGAATVSWLMHIPQSGRYAVYVSYASLAESIPDALYSVYHRGGRTDFLVNQQMGGGTWVYLGTFDFEKGLSSANKIELSNVSEHKGVVTADGVRIGGGMGQTSRGGAGVSGLPRFLEAARYYAQWAGVPDSLFNTTKGENDYADDLRVRGNMLNWMAGGSRYLPNRRGLNIPFELSLALHSDAGVSNNDSIYGSLAISTTKDDYGNAYYSSGLSRDASFDFSSMLLTMASRDLSHVFGRSWTRRELWDRNYAETRIPDVPSAILEMLSHQNFQDMKYGHDPLFKQTLARSIYKTILRYVSYMHGIRDVVVQPLPPRDVASIVANDGASVHLSWAAQRDPLEETANPEGYVLYTQKGDSAFDNGVFVGNVTELILPIETGVAYSFRISAINAGGESFPSETLSVYSAGGNSPHILIVNGFDRISGPAWVERNDSLGFDLKEDIGVPDHYTTEYSGYQFDFRSHTPEYNSGNELQGRQLAGNTFDFPTEHGEAITASRRFTYSSVSRDFFARDDLDLSRFCVIDYIAGLQADLPYNLRKYEVFPFQVRHRLSEYLQNGGNLFVSGSYIGRDHSNDREKATFTKEMLGFKSDRMAAADSTDYVNVDKARFEIYRELNGTHYAAQSLDRISPVNKSGFTAFTYGNGESAGVAYSDKKYKVVSMGFPFECIKSKAVRRQVMDAILQFLVD